MTMFNNPTFRKWLIGLGSTVLTVTAGQAIALRDKVNEQEIRLEAVEEATKALPEIKSDIAVLRDRSDREWGVK